MAMRLLIPGLLCLFLAVPCLAQPELAAVGEIVYQADFEGADALDGWNGSATLEPGCKSDQALAIERPADSPVGSTVAQFQLPVERVRGCVLYFAGMVKAENVSDKPQSWNGIKYMAPSVYEGGRSYPQADIGVGTFDWKRVVFQVAVPKTATDLRLYMGLESVTGKVWFDNLKVWVRKGPFVPKPPVTDGDIYKGHDLPRLRGAMISPNIQEESLRLFADDWNANVVRWQLVGWRPKEGTLDLAAYDTWLAEQLAKLDTALPLCEKYGLYVVVDLHSQPSGGAGSGANMFTNAECQKTFIENWRMMARKYRASKAVWGYDLVNEPLERVVGEGLLDWQQLSEAAAKAIREIDPEHAIIVETPAGGGPSGFTRMNPIDVPNVIYSVHMYLPHAFTHQGVYGQWDKHYTYPGEIGGQMWDKAQIETALKPAIDFAQRYRVHMYVGEFSAIRWAPDGSAYRYLRDCIDVFEKYGWDWTYHAFREWSGWSVEHGPDKDDTSMTAEPTDRKTLMLEWFGKNEKPEW